MIKEFAVYGLFGQFDHKIYFKENITLLLGPNGCGKTTLLKLFHFVFSNDIKGLLKYQFYKISIIFSDEIRVDIEKKIDGNIDVKRKKLRQLIEAFEFSLNGNICTDLEDENYFSPLNDMSIGERRRMEVEINTDYEEEIVSYVEYKRHEEYLSRMKKSFIPKDIKSLLDTVVVDFVTTNRLLNIDVEEKNRFRDQSTSMHRNMVEQYSEELITKIKDSLSEYANLSQQLDGEFPGKILEAMKMNAGSLIKEKLEENYEQINKLRDKHIKTGILENSTDKYLKYNISEIDNKTFPIFNIYYKDTKCKLESLNNLSSRIELFINLVNDKLNYDKGIRITKEKGIEIYQTVFNGNENLINLSDLSSGEQQEIVLLYRLIFTAKENEIILIDEPELSLHITWQRQFIEDLKEIIKLNKIQVLIATHSPQIINNNWDLTMKIGEVD